MFFTGVFEVYLQLTPSSESGFTGKILNSGQRCAAMGTFTNRCAGLSSK